MKRAGGSLLIVALLAVGLTLWIGPRPVLELWVAERLDAARLRELFPNCPELPPGPVGSPARVEALAEANGLDPAALPPLGPGAQLFDADNDGDLDLFVASPPPQGLTDAAGPRSFSLYQNDGGGELREIGEHLGDAFSGPPEAWTPGVVQDTWCVDVDRDGLLDVIVSLEGERFLCLHNRFARRRHLTVRPVPAETRSGAATTLPGTARVVIVAAGREQVRLVDVGPGRSLLCPPEAHFGLGDLEKVEAVYVQWPSGLRTEIHDVPAGAEEVLLEPTPQPVTSPPRADSPKRQERP